MFSSIAAALCTRCLFLLASAALAFSLATTTGDPTSHVLDPRAGKAERETLRHELKLDRPIATRLAGLIGSVVVGDLGRSWQSGQQVTQMIADAAPVTLELTVVALLIALIAALPLAVTAASHPSSVFARAIRTLSLIAVGLPTFITALLLISLFAAGFGRLPAFGRGATVNVLGWRTGLVTASGLMSVRLPAVTIAMTLTGYFVRVVECELRRVLGQDYITAARARGIGARWLYFVHALANACPPLIATTAVQFGNITAFALVTETMFQRAGLGLMFFRSIENADMPVIAGLVMLAGVVFTPDCRRAPDHRRPKNPRTHRPERTVMTASTLGPIGKFRAIRPRNLLLACIGVAIALIIAAPNLVAPHDPMNLANIDLVHAHQPPMLFAVSDGAFPLGTDEQGRCLLSMVVFGTRTSLFIAIIATAIAASFATMLGLIAALSGRTIDAVIKRLAELQLTYPAIVVALLLEAVLRAGNVEPKRSASSVAIVIAALALASWPQFALTVRAVARSQLPLDYVVAAISIGQSRTGVACHHLWPAVRG